MNLFMLAIFLTDNYLNQNNASFIDLLNTFAKRWHHKKMLTFLFKFVQTFFCILYILSYFLIFFSQSHIYLFLSRICIFSRLVIGSLNNNIKMTMKARDWKYNENLCNKFTWWYVFFSDRVHKMLLKECLSGNWQT